MRLGISAKAVGYLPRATALSSMTHLRNTAFEVVFSLKDHFPEKQPGRRIA